MADVWKAEKGSELAKLRMAAHRELDPYWTSRGYARAIVYKTLAHKMRMKRADCHIGALDEEQCRRVIAICREGLLK